MSTQEKLAGIRETIKLIRQARDEQLRLLAELQTLYELALAAGVEPEEIASSGYCQAADPRWRKWPPHLRQKLESGEIPKGATFVVLKDGRRIGIEPDWKGPLEAWKAEQKKKAEAHWYPSGLR